MTRWMWRWEYLCIGRAMPWLLTYSRHCPVVLVKGEMCVAKAQVYRLVQLLGNSISSKPIHGWLRDFRWWEKRYSCLPLALFNVINVGHVNWRWQYLILEIQAVYGYRISLECNTLFVLFWRRCLFLIPWVLMGNWDFPIKKENNISKLLELLFFYGLNIEKFCWRFSN